MLTVSAPVPLFVDPARVAPTPGPQQQLEPWTTAVPEGDASGSSRLARGVKNWFARRTEWYAAQVELVRPRTSLIRPSPPAAAHRRALAALVGLRSSHSAASTAPLGAMEAVELVGWP